MRFLATLLLVLLAAPAHAVSIQEVASKNGIKAWLVEDHKLPLVAMRFAFRGGVEQDPADRQGLANLTVNMLTQGAGAYDAAAFQQELADHSIQMSFDANRDALLGGLKTLKEEQGKAFELLRLALTQPRFDTTELERQRGQQLAALRFQLGNPEWQARYALFQQIFGTHPYGSRRLGSTESLARITRDDIASFAAQHLARSNLIIAVAGDITGDELVQLLDQTFGALPEHAALTPMTDVVWPKIPATILVSREGTQTNMLFALPGPKRDNPDWHAAEIANYILGGGGFSSRLMQDVRDKEGLTYGIATSLSPMDYGGVLAGETAVDNPQAGKAWARILETMRRFYEDGASEKELAAAKDYLTGALPLTMTSTDKIAAILVALQLDGQSRDYLNQHSQLVRRVTAEDVRRVIQRWFNPAGLTLSLAGQPEGIVPTVTKDLVRD
ncbi:MAG: pitrilysin family protein [Alphaproteobacteria bacterium]|nr:pitrilysin family protein [Alphaproteobacteria bacterium]